MEAQEKNQEEELNLEKWIREGLDLKNWRRRDKLIFTGWLIAFIILFSIYINEVKHPTYCIDLENGSRVCNESLVPTTISISFRSHTVYLPKNYTAPSL